MNELIVHLFGGATPSDISALDREIAAQGEIIRQLGHPEWESHPDVISTRTSEVKSPVGYTRIPSYAAGLNMLVRSLYQKKYGSNWETSFLRAINRHMDL